VCLLRKQSQPGQAGTKGSKLTSRQNMYGCTEPPNHAYIHAYIQSWSHATLWNHVQLNRRHTTLVVLIFSTISTQIYNFRCIDKNRPVQYHTILIKKTDNIYGDEYITTIPTIKRST